MTSWLIFSQSCLKTGTLGKYIASVVIGSGYVILISGVTLLFERRDENIDHLIMSDIYCKAMFVQKSNNMTGKQPQNNHTDVPKMLKHLQWGWWEIFERNYPVLYRRWVILQYFSIGDYSSQSFRYEVLTYLWKNFSCKYLFEYFRTPCTVNLLPTLQVKRGPVPRHLDLLRFLKRQTFTRR